VDWPMVGQPMFDSGRAAPVLERNRPANSSSILTPRRRSVPDTAPCRFSCTISLAGWSTAGRGRPIARLRSDRPSYRRRPRQTTPAGARRSDRDVPRRADDSRGAIKEHSGPADRSPRGRRFRLRRRRDRPRRSQLVRHNNTHPERSSIVFHRRPPLHVPRRIPSNAQAPCSERGQTPRRGRHIRTCVSSVRPVTRSEMMSCEDSGGVEVSS